MKKGIASSAPHKPRWYTRGKEWVHRHPQRTYAIVGATVIVVAGSIAAFMLTRPMPGLDLTPIKVKKPAPAKVYYSPLTGNKVADEAATKQAITAIMIENSPDARPQSGLKQAGIVYEAIAEGGITRYLALYQEAKPQIIGPVRSLRMYYLDWAAGYGAGIVHFGGSAASLAEVGNGQYHNLDLMVGNSYWRATDRYAPHNVYTSFEKLDALESSKGYTSSSFTGWPREDGKVAEAASQNAKTIDVVISNSLFNSHYDYDAASNTYLRSVGGEPSNDREDGRIAPNVVVALKVDMNTVMEDGYRESITTTGAGGAVVFQNGTATECTWRKNSRTEPLQLTDTNGKELTFNRGQTWVAAVPNGSGSISWQ